MSLRSLIRRAARPAPLRACPAALLGFLLAAAAGGPGILMADPPSTPPPSSAPAAPKKAVPAPAASPNVARVNGTPISRRDFELAVQISFQQRRPGERTHGDLQAVRTAVLDNLIDNELLYQEAVRAKTSVTEAEVKKEVQALEESLGSPEDIAAFFKANGVTEKELADQVRRSQVVRRFVDQKMVTAEGGVDEKELRAYYDAHAEMFARPESVHLSQIVVRLTDAASPAARSRAREKIEAILTELRKGSDFAEMARLHSEGPEAPKGGDSGWVWAGGGALPVVERAALALQAGQTSDIVESRRGFHILKVTERRPAGAVSFEEARPKIKDRVVADQRQEKLRVYVAGLRRKASIEKTL